jgi:enoyl-CoA hydratase/carnithine racemase
MNALDVATKENIGEIFQELDNRRGEVRAVILRGAVEKGFAAGADSRGNLLVADQSNMDQLARMAR